MLALHDYFTEKVSKSQSLPLSTATAADNEGPSEPDDDAWCLAYITIRRIQPLLEALDEDGSTFVTVNELNRFSAARPDGWRCVFR